MLTLFAMNLEKMLFYIVPALVCLTALRRVWMSQSFNRLLYVVVAIYAVMAIHTATELRDGSKEMEVVLRIVSYGSVWFWVLACELARSTGSARSYSDRTGRLYRRYRADALAPAKPREIDQTPWANLPRSAAPPAAPSTQSGPGDATPVAPGTA